MELDGIADLPVPRLEDVIKQAVQVGISQPDRPISFGLQPNLEVNLTLTTDERIHQLNREYRGQDKPTDVLSFSQIEGDASFVAAPRGSLSLGDVVISVETARRQAKGTIEDELRLLAVHGALPVEVGRRGEAGGGELGAEVGHQRPDGA